MQQVAVSSLCVYNPMNSKKKQRVHASIDIQTAQTRFISVAKGECWNQTTCQRFIHGELRIYLFLLTSIWAKYGLIYADCWRSANWPASSGGYIY